MSVFLSQSEEDRLKKHLKKHPFVSLSNVGDSRFQLQIEQHLILYHTVKSMLAALSNNPKHLFQIIKKANKEYKEAKQSVTVAGERLLTPEGVLRPLREVFEEAYRDKVQQKKTFQPVESSWRLCFQLEEPSSTSPDTTPDKEASWFLRFLFQSLADPSLLVDLDKATGLDALTYFNALREASLKFPLLDQWMQAGMPSGLPLAFPDVLRFLGETGPMLQEAGFGIRLPLWCGGRADGRKLSLIARVSEETATGGSRLSLDDIVRVDYAVALGEHPLTLEELQSVAQLKIPLVQMRGKWVYFTAEELQAVSALLESGSRGNRTVAEVIRLTFSTEMRNGLSVKQVVESGRLKSLLDHLDRDQKFVELPLPKGVCATLRPYQLVGYSWMAFLTDLGLGACLADDMGLGKSLQALTVIQRCRNEGSSCPVLLVCPTSVIGNWRQEARRFTPSLPTCIHHGDDRAGSPGLFFHRVRDQALVITSYSLLSRDIDLFRSFAWSGLILDEAQNIKNPETKQAKAAKAISARFRIALTGTPVENSIRDLWSILDFLNPGFLGTWEEFEKRFFLPIQNHQDPEALSQLQRITRVFLLRRLKSDRSVIADLPEKREMTVYCTLTREQATLYEAVLRNHVGQLGDCEGIRRKGLVLSLLGKLKQICNHPAQYLQDRSDIGNRSGKLSRLTEMMEEVLSVDERALIFTQFTDTGEILRHHLSERFDREVLFLHGGVGVAERDRMVERFQSPSGPSIFVLSLRAGGTGLNLTNATHVFHFDRWWNPAVENQATDRAYRIGQQFNVMVHTLLCSGTLEDRIDEVIQRKKDLTTRVIESGEGWLTELSTQDLHDLLRLSDESVVID